jgi:hypothetical protein
MSQRGTVLAETRTRPFDVVRHHEYSASGKLFSRYMDSSVGVDISG